MMLTLSRTQVGYAGQQSRNNHPPCSFGVFYPEGDVVAIIDSLATARRAAAALCELSIADSEIVVLDGHEYYAAAQTERRRLTPVQRLSALLSRLFSDDAADEQELLDEARQGHAVLRMHAARDETADRVRTVLLAHEAHSVRRYCRGYVEQMAYAEPSAARPCAFRQ